LWFFEIGSLWTICPGWPQARILLISASWIAGIIHIGYHAWPIFFISK
jgi:hypothetical protein